MSYVGPEARMRHPFRLLIVASTIPLLGLLRSARAQHNTPHIQLTYAVTDLRTLGGDTSEANAINRAGEVVGSSETGAIDSTGNAIRHAFRWKLGVLHDLGTLGGANSAAFGINDRGEVVGQADDASEYTDRTHAVRWSPSGEITRLRDKYGSRALAINNRGQIVGIAAGNFSPERAALWQAGKLFFIGADGGDPGAAYGLNDQGWIAGYKESPGGSLTFVHWRVTPAHSSSPHIRYRNELNDNDANGAAYAVNNQGQFVGSWHGAFVWQSGTLTNLGMLPGYSSSRAYGINNHGEIVGSSFNHDGWWDGIGKATLWLNGQMYDLNAFIPSTSGWMLEKAAAINNRGQIVGTGLHSGVRRAFLLTPQ